MNKVLLLALVLCCPLLNNAYKVVVFAPALSNSQLIWNKRIAETLTNAGHNVTLIKAFHVRADSSISFDDRIRVIDVNTSTGVDMAALQEIQARVIFKSGSMLDQEHRKMMFAFAAELVNMCEVFLKNKEFLNWLRNENFDIALTHMYTVCEIGIIHHVGIPSWAWVSSARLLDYMANTAGVPSPSSYVSPAVMSAKDEMSFYERIKSFIGHSLMSTFAKWFVYAKFDVIFKEHLDPNFPAIEDICREVPLVFVNSNEFYDFPRPILHKIVYIGGLGVKFSDAKPLAGDFASIADKADGLVVFSFGSVANSSYMPEEWKQAFLDAFASFPRIHFFFRYTTGDLNDRLPPNVHISKWLPQADLLQHPKTKAFISHGGYNSVQETISAGVPLITLALFADQYKNAELTESLGLGIKLDRSHITKETISTALREIIENNKYKEKAQRIRAMVQKKPAKAEEMLVRWTEFAAEFKTLDNLTPHGARLGFVQYYQIDVVAFLCAVGLLITFLLVQLVLLPFKLLRRCLKRQEKVKMQ